jgi:3-oxoacyl-[acyl-carrier protein] reductase
MNLDGKIGIVTGGGQGIGKAIATRLAMDGETVVIADLAGSAGAKTAEALNGAGYKSKFIPVDVTSASDVDALMRETFESFGSISTLVTCAGILTPPLSFEDNSEALFDKVIAVNLKGTFLCIKSVIPYLKKQRSGSIICIASRAGIRVGIKNAPYGCSKAGVIMLAQCAAKELAEYGVRVNSLAPGLTEVESVTQEVKDHLSKTLLMGSLVDPEEHGSVVSYLASDECKHLTGVTITLDGGQNL